MSGIDRGRGPWTEWDQPRERWLLTEGDDAAGRPRSLLLEVTARLVFPTVLLVSVYLVFAGHHHAGGGFSGGLVAGLGFVLRYLAGGGAELRAAMIIRPPVLIGLGLVVTVAVALVPALLGVPVLTSAEWHPRVPLLGELKVSTNQLFDIGVYLLILGVVLDLLRTLGAGIEARVLEHARERGAR
ncbi:multicomponent Na+:H+ antiporter subunit B [Amycolatopsis arida]|uniref:Multicomponent Na+:H+ antiporter subunit B n=1 Tax=Amycolatopsis arida TaxID=587909 RepID=A0A1I6AX57_9PSEU|nr:MnhB domain-containing protein [Amycolatopsis arida]TDX85366.1 multicomponent Na+:H+ antiporter subunit B [Amycolatopsis arida]SFQ73223.1 multicomponent Na+:H+ antiporter subunit B [Amycolatopsis arida]